MRRLFRYAPAPASAREHLIASGIDDHAADQLAGAFQRQRHVEHRKSVREVGGAVERIDVPAIFGRSCVAAAFLGHDGVRGEVALQALDDQPLAGAVGFGHQVVLALELEAVIVLAAPLYRSGNERRASRPISIAVSRKEGTLIRAERLQILVKGT